MYMPPSARSIRLANVRLGHARVFGLADHADTLPEPPRSVHEAPAPRREPRRPAPWAKLARALKLWRARQYLKLCQTRRREALGAYYRAKASIVTWEAEIYDIQDRIAELASGLDGIRADEIPY